MALYRLRSRTTSVWQRAMSIAEYARPVTFSWPESA
jgi:hypothetical protein